MMDSTRDENNDEVELNLRTLWVGNLHPEVTGRHIFELFYQIGPVMYVEFSYDEHETCENFALVIFKYACSVEDSIKLLHGTKLFQTPISMKHYSEYFEYHEELHNFKQLLNVLHANESNSSSKHQNKNNYNKSRSPFRKNEHNSVDKSYHDRGHYQNQEYNSSSGSLEMSNNNKNVYHDQSHDCKYRDYDVQSSSKQKRGTFNNKEHSFSNEKISANGILPVCDLRDTLRQKRKLNSDYHNDDTNTNRACTSMLNLRDATHHNNGSECERHKQQYEPDTTKEWSDRKHKNEKKKNNFSSDQKSRTNTYDSERYNKSNNYYTDQGYYDQSPNDECTNNYNESRNLKKNRSNNNNYSRNRSQHIESSSRQPNSYHSYTKSYVGRERKESKNSFDHHQSGHNRNRYIGREKNDRSSKNNVVRNYFNIEDKKKNY